MADRLERAFSNAYSLQQKPFYFFIEVHYLKFAS